LFVFHASLPLFPLFSDLRWNALGMMNNSYYRVRVETRMPRGVDGPTFLRFQHPVQPGAAVGGWQKPLASAVGMVTDGLPRVGPPLGLAAHRAHKLISAEEVAKHQSAEDCWLVMDETVYDVSPYMKDHPGGGDALLAAIHVPPMQLSTLFKSIHAADAYEITGQRAAN
jgi:nitrate reductase (NAD(P)H)